MKTIIILLLLTSVMFAQINEQDTTYINSRIREERAKMMTLLKISEPTESRDFFPERLVKAFIKFWDEYIEKCKTDSVKTGFVKYDWFPDEATATYDTSYVYVARWGVVPEIRKWYIAVKYKKRDLYKPVQPSWEGFIEFLRRRL